MHNLEKEKHPSFSSTLLDEIYRSFDSNTDFNLQYRNKKIEKWLPDDTCDDAEFSRSEYVMKQNQRVGATTEENNLIKSKSRALKIYANLKKAKQPLSPGGRLSTFLNSLFTNGNNGKKAKTARGFEESKSTQASSSSSSSTCSSASSFTRSCLSKTPPGSRKNSLKRSVTFNPVGVIFDEDCRPCGHKHIYDPHSNEFERSKYQENGAELKLYRMMERNREFETAKNDILERYLNLKNKEYDAREYDAASDASSDLFEIDFGGKTFSEELPVYETTNLHTNRAIVRGFVY